MAIIEEGKADALRLHQEILDKARGEAEEWKQRAHREVELATDQAKKELWEESTRLSLLLAERILQRSLNAADHKALVQEFLQQLRATPAPRA
jgi:F-type H+-transporting ATPase subunit b